MMAMAAKGARDHRPENSISTPQISAMTAKKNPRVSVTIDEPPCVQLTVRPRPNRRGGASSLTGPAPLEGALRPGAQGRRREATTGFEPVITVLQTAALPLGYVARGLKTNSTQRQPAGRGAGEFGCV
jgi:hypothetical protein